MYILTGGPLCRQSVDSGSMALGTLTGRGAYDSRVCRSTSASYWNNAQDIANILDLMCI